jgi:hypothetical protein
MYRAAEIAIPVSPISRWNFFAEQLGTPIRDLSLASPTIKQIMIALTMIAGDDVDRGMRLLSAPAKRLPDIEIIPSGKHAFVLTEVIALAERARERVAIGRFIFNWVESLDPSLFDLLSGTGHPVKAVPVAGIFVHYMAEKTFGGPLTTPQVGAAVAAANNSHRHAKKTTSTGFLRRKHH